MNINVDMYTNQSKLDVFYNWCWDESGKFFHKPLKNKEKIEYVKNNKMSKSEYIRELMIKLLQYKGIKTLISINSSVRLITLDNFNKIKETVSDTTWNIFNRDSIFLKYNNKVYVIFNNIKSNQSPDKFIIKAERILDKL